MTNASPLQAIIYTRVSTDEQVENGTSLEGQYASCVAKAKAIGAEVVAHYEDAGVSGGYYFARPGIQKALSDLEAGKAQILITTRIDRFSRDREHQATMKKRIERAGGRLIFCEMDFDDSPEGELAENVLGDFAHYYRKYFRSQSMKGKRRLAEKGIQPCRAMSPYGYYIPSKKDVLAGLYPAGTQGTYLVNEEQAKWVPVIFEMLASGSSLRKICDYLNHSGVPSPRNNSGGWIPSTLKHLIANPTYKGKPAYGRCRAHSDEQRLERGLKPHYQVATDPKTWTLMEAPALVAESLWERCQTVLKENQKRYSGNPRRKNMLTGLMRCSKCRKSMTCKHHCKSKYYYYACPEYNNRHRSFYKPCPNCSRTYTGRHMESLTISAIQDVARRPEQIEDALEAYRAHHAAQTDNGEQKRLGGQLEKLAAREKTIIEGQLRALEVGGNVAAYDAMLREVAAKITETRQRLDAIETATPTPLPKPKTVSAIFGEVMAAVDEALCAQELTQAEKHDLLARIVKEIYPDGEGIVITLQPPVSLHGQTVESVSTSRPCKSATAMQIPAMLARQIEDCPPARNA
jgi:DNA invertase Pin-like site-specific DNA recombinase